MKRTIITLLIGMGCFGVRAQIPLPDPDTTARHFLTVASIDNLQEVSAGQLAMQKAKSADVRSFGQMMVKDHGQAEQQLTQLAKTENISIPAEAAGGIQPDINLKNAGGNFDKLYVHAMVPGHRSAVGMFQNYVTTGKDPVVREFAQQMLPTLKAHLDAITALDKQLNTNNK